MSSGCTERTSASERRKTSLTGNRVANKLWLGVAASAGGIEEQLAALRAAGHDVVTTVDHTGARTLTVDGVTFGGPTLADCLHVAGLA